MDYISEVDEIIDVLKDKQPVMIQLPSGLSRYAVEISRYLEEKGIENYIYGDETFGACDLPLEECKRIGCKSILHFAHTPFLKENIIDGIHLYYVPLFVNYDVNDAANIIAEECKQRELNFISLHSPIQYAHKLEELKEKLLEKGLKVLLEKSPLQQYPGQILGCEVSSAILSKNKGAECLIYIGDGMFHYTALMRDVDLPMLVYNPVTRDKKFIPLEEIHKFRKKYYMAYGAIESSKKIGILVSSKIGQYSRFSSSLEHIIEEFKRKGKEVFVFIGDKIDYNQISALSEGVEAFINLACPRIEDDKEIFPKPIISYTTYKKIEREINASTNNR